MEVFDLITKKQASDTMGIATRTLEKLQEVHLAPTSVYVSEGKPMLPRREVHAVALARLKGARAEEVRTLVARLQAERDALAAKLLTGVAA